LPPLGGAQVLVAGSCASGFLPSSAASMIAASVTVRAIGPGVSWSAVIGMTPYRLMRPTVGLMPTSMFAFAGLRIEPDVSVPTFPPHKLAAVPIPELEPPTPIDGRPSANGIAKPSFSDRGSFLGSYGFIPQPPPAL